MSIGTGAEISPPRTLTLRYIAALLAVAALLVVAQVVVQVGLARAAEDGRIVNVAGRQRMLSQRLCVELLAMEQPGEVRAARLLELSRVTDDWEQSHRLLREGSGSREAHLAELFDRLEADRLAMLAAARSALGGRSDGAAPAALAHETGFLRVMDSIVDEYESRSRSHVATLRRTELSVLALVLAVLAVEGLLVFRPAVRALRTHLAAAAEAQREVVRVSDREQRRISQDLHDGLGQDLVGIATLLKSLRGRAGALEPDLAEIGGLLGQAVDQTRDLARGLYSHTLETEGLCAALSELGNGIEKMFDVVCSVSCVLAREPPTETRAHAYRILREAALNAAKHANAGRIDVVLRGGATSLTLEVKDDGAGFDPGPSKGMGLRLMASRAKVVGARLEVTRAPAGGTIVSCVIPLLQAES